MLRCIFSGINRGFWINVAARLSRSAGVEVFYWIAGSWVMDDISKTFPGAAVQCKKKAMRGIYPNILPGTKFPALGNDLLKIYRETQSRAIEMMDILDSENTIDYQKRYDLYQEQLRYWLGIVHSHKPDLVLFAITPYQVYDFILYKVCKQEGIPTLLFEDTSIGRIFLRTDFEHDFPIARQYDRLISQNRHSAEIDLGDALEKRYAGIRKDYDEGMPYFMKKYHSNGTQDS